MSVTTYYDYRISNTQKYLEQLTKERDETIERLKAATKYNSTQQLLEKYGASPKPKQQTAPSSAKKDQGPQRPQRPQGPRTNIAPPPTANIQRIPSQQPQTPPKRLAQGASPQGPRQAQMLPPPPDSPGAEFAPNAYDAAELTRQYSSSTAATFTQTHWYDRILDALLGEDETQPKNRLVLICSECRLVNGQAPPGTRTLEDVGRWRCGGCRAWNGKEKVKEDVVASLVEGWESERKAKEKELTASTDGGIDSDNRETEDDAGMTVGHEEGSGVDMADDSATDIEPPSKSTRSKSKAKGRK